MRPIAEAHLFSYILPYDSGFAPNPSGRACTLACCKPVIRRTASPDDWVIATTPAPDPGRLTYAMRVTQALTFDLYWEAFPEKRPSEDRRGDNIYRPDSTRRLVQVPNPSHDERSVKRDLSANRVLISSHFYYFGRAAPLLPPQFHCLLAATRGHRRIRPGSKDHPQFIAFVAWLEREFQPGRTEEPHLEEVICLPPEEDEPEVDE